MKKLLLILFIITTKIGLSQNTASTIRLNNKNEIEVTELKSNDDFIFYQYRFSFDNLNNLAYTNAMMPQLIELFKTNVRFYEILKQFIVESEEDVQKYDLEKLFQNTDMRLNYFRKDLVNKINQ